MVERISQSVTKKLSLNKNNMLIIHTYNRSVHKQFTLQIDNNQVSV